MGGSGDESSIFIYVQATGLKRWRCWSGTIQLLRLRVYKVVTSLLNADPNEKLQMLRLGWRKMAKTCWQTKLEDVRQSRGCELITGKEMCCLMCWNHGGAHLSLLNIASSWWRRFECNYRIDCRVKTKTFESVARCLSVCVHNKPVIPCFAFVCLCLFVS